MKYSVYVTHSCSNVINNSQICFIQIKQWRKVWLLQCFVDTWM